MPDILHALQHLDITKPYKVGKLYPLFMTKETKDRVCDLTKILQEIHCRTRIINAVLSYSEIGVRHFKSNQLDKGHLVSHVELYKDLGILATAMPFFGGFFWFCL